MENKGLMKMERLIIKSCPNLVNSTYADGREVHDECGSSTRDEKCTDIEDCLLKNISRNLAKVVNSGTCSRCDGCGYYEGCTDEDCGTYQAYKCLDLLNIEKVE